MPRCFNLMRGHSSPLNKISVRKLWNRVVPVAVPENMTHEAYEENSDKIALFAFTLALSDIHLSSVNFNRMF